MRFIGSRMGRAGRLALGACVLLTFASGQANAAELQVIGHSSVPIGADDPSVVRNTAIKEATKKAIITAIEKVLGAGTAADPRVSGKIDQIVAQIPDDKLVEKKGKKIGSNYDMTVTVVLDDKEFRTLLSDQGVAINTAKNRAHSMLAMMDEFLTYPKDLKAPLEELTVFHRESGASLSDRSQSHDSGSANMQASQSGGSSGYYGSSGHHGQASASARHSSSNKNDVAAEQHDNVTYAKLTKYQPQNTAPEKTSQVYNALCGQLQDYDLKILDNDQFKSKFFKNKPLTIQEMQNSEDLSKFIAYAKTEAHADFLMVGTAIIIDSGKSASTGQNVCSGVASVKTYSAVSGESIANETISEVATGIDIHDCAGKLSKKLARIGGPIIGGRVQDYWKRREMYGQEHVLALVGANLPLMTRINFTKAVKSVPGVENATQRVGTDKRLELVVTYKGTDPLDAAVAGALSSNAQFSSLDSRTEGDQIILCMGPCKAFVK